LAAGNSQSSTPRLLFVSNVLPGSFGVGSIYLRDLLSETDPDSVAFFSSTPSLPGESFTGTVFKDSFPQIGSRLSRASGGVSDLAGMATARLSRRSSLARLQRAILEWRPDLVVLILFDNWVITEAGEACRRAGVPTMSIVWDPPAYLCSLWNLPPLSAHALMKSFEGALRSSKAILYPSQAMQKLYSKEYSKPSEVGIHSPSINLQPVPFRADDGVFRIGFSGGMYTRENWSVLLETIGSTDWKVQDRPVEIVVMGSYLNLPRVTGPVRISFLGYVDMQTQVNVLAGCDLLYLPYPFDERFKNSVKYSFPNKLGVYAAAGVPVLFHGPSNSSVLRILEKYTIGPVCTSLQSEELKRTLDEVFNKERDVCYRSQLRRLRQDELNLEIFQQRFVQLVTAAVNA